MTERDKKMGTRLEKMSSKLEGIGASNGIIAETFFEQATENGITLNIKGKKSVFKQTASNFVVYDELLNHKAEIDLFMTNGDYVLLIETKYRLDKKHIEKIPHKIAMLEKYAPKAVAGKKILTAFASLGCKKSVKEFLTENGHFVFTENNNKIHTASLSIFKRSKDRFFCCAI